MFELCEHAEHVFALLQRVGVAHAARQAFAAPVVGQHVEAGLVQRVQVLAPPALAHGLGGAVGERHRHGLAAGALDAVGHLVRMLERRELPAAARRHDGQGAHLAAAPVVHAGAFEVPAAQLDRVGELQVEPLEGVARHGELDDVGARVGLGNAFAVGRLREEGGAADLLQIDRRAVGIDAPGRIDRARHARGARLVGRQPALHLRVHALEAGRLGLAGVPARLELVVGERAHVVVAARVIGGHGVGAHEHGHAHARAAGVHRGAGLRQQVAAHPRVAVGADPGRAVGGRRLAGGGLALFGRGAGGAGGQAQQGTEQGERKGGAGRTHGAGNARGMKNHVIGTQPRRKKGPRRTKREQMDADTVAEGMPARRV
ncbi:hypothetical protein D9M68_622470 [compost metagenome]